MQPTHGGRVDPKLRAAAPALTYAVELYTPESVFQGAASVDLSSGAVTFDTFEPAAPPEWLVLAARSLLRAGFRSKPDGGWPRRTTRWRAEPSRDKP